MSAQRESTKLKVLSVVGLIGLMLLPSSFAAAKAAAKQEAKPAETAVGAGDEKVDVTDLEKKYWASKDTDFSVVQNRLYSKANRLALSLQYGFLINDQWSDGPTMGGSLGYYFSERFGVEGQYQSTGSTDNKSLANLKAQAGVANHGKIKSYQGASFNFVPFYAKMSVMNSSIIYFDMAISPGVGMTSYEQQRRTGNQEKNAPTVSLDITQSFFFSKYSAFRVDYRNRWFQEEVVSYNTGASVSTETSQTSLLMFGFTFFY